MFSALTSCIKSEPFFSQEKPLLKSKQIYGLKIDSAIITIAAIGEILAFSLLGRTNFGVLNGLGTIGNLCVDVLLGTSIFLLLVDAIPLMLLMVKRISQSNHYNVSILEGEETKSKNQICNNNSRHQKSAPLHEEIFEHEYVEPNCAIEKLPQEIFLSIFIFLRPEELESCCLVNHLWNRLASSDQLWRTFDLKKLFPAITIFDASEWALNFNQSRSGVMMEDLGLTTNDLSGLDLRKTILNLKKNFFSKIKNEAGVTLLTIPKGLSLQKLKTLAGQWRETSFYPIAYDLLNHIGEIEVLQSYRIAITNAILSDSLNRSRDQQLEFVHERNCEVPKALEVATLLFVSFHAFQKRLYRNTYTLCSDEVNGLNTFVGGYTEFGPRIDLERFYPSCHNGIACSLHIPKNL
jgi:hypothetical protein